MENDQIKYHFCLILANMFFIGTVILTNFNNIYNVIVLGLFGWIWLILALFCLLRPKKR